MIGTELGSYRILEQLGEGGMGVVYKAIDTSLDRLVAVKVLSAEFSRNPELMERFRMEARAQANLNHANIAMLHAFLVQGGQAWMVMELVDGETISQMLQRRGLLPPNVAVPLFKQALLGIRYAHRMGIIHRDIKPPNLMVNRDGIVKVMDFGIAKVLGSRGMTRTGTTVGTVNYMSPEQVMNRAVDIRSDIYSLGVTLFEMLTASLPFQGESEFQILSDHVHTPPPPPTRYYPYIPKGIESAVLRAMAKDPDARFQTVEEFGAALELSDTAVAVPVSSPAVTPPPIPGPGTGTPAGRMPGATPPPATPQRATPPPVMPPPVARPSATPPPQAPGSSPAMVAATVVAPASGFQTTPPPPPILGTPPPGQPPVPGPSLLATSKGKAILGTGVAVVVLIGFLSWPRHRVEIPEQAPMTGGAVPVTPKLPEKEVPVWPPPAPPAPDTSTGKPLGEILGGKNDEQTHSGAEAAPPAKLKPMLDAQPAAIAGGQSTVLRWSVSGAQSVEIQPGIGVVPATGSRRVSPAQTTSYTLVARASNGATGTARATVEVQPATPPPPVTPVAPVVTLSATPDSVPPGGSAVLSWSIQNAVAAAIMPAPGNLQQPEGRISVRPQVTTTYTLTAKSKDGTISTATALVQVTAPAAPPVIAGGTSRPIMVMHDHGGAAGQVWPSCYGSLQVVNGVLRYVVAGTTDGRRDDFQVPLSQAQQVEVNKLRIRNQPAFHITIRGQHFNFVATGMAPGDAVREIEAAAGRK